MGVIRTTAECLFPLVETFDNATSYQLCDFSNNLFGSAHNLLVWFDSLRSSQQLFSHVGTVLLG